MAATKYSRQREAILSFLMTRKDHPTADVIYAHVQKEFPKISLGTVYRNLALLSEQGDILKLSLDNSSDHFDANTKPHYHFICTKCSAVIDLEIDNLDFINEMAGKNFDGHISGHSTFFYGRCKDCID